MTSEINQDTDRVNREQYAEDLQDCQWLLVQVLQIEQLDPEQFLGCGVIGDEVYGERGLRDSLDEAVVEGDAVEQQEHAETHHDDG